MNTQIDNTKTPSRNNPLRRASLGKLVAVGLATALFTAIAGLAFHALADQMLTTDDVPRQIPYHGKLTLDGAPLTEEGFWIKLELVDGELPVYAQSMQVDIQEGEFNTVLGPVDDEGRGIEQVLASADNLRLRTTLLYNHSASNPTSTADDDIVMDNPQTLFALPHALWTPNATNLVVNKTLYAANNVNIEGTTRVRGIGSNDGRIIATGQVSASAFRLEDRDRVLGQQYDGATWFINHEPYAASAQPSASAPSGSQGSVSNWSRRESWSTQSGDPSYFNRYTFCFTTEMEWSVGDVANASALASGFTVGCKTDTWILGGGLARTEDAAATASARCHSRCIRWPNGFGEL